MGLVVHDLACRRGGRLVFRGMSFELAAGELLLVTGANGSGKSSLLRVMAGLAAADSGALIWDGVAVDTDWRGWQGRVNYVGHLDAVKPELTVGEMVRYWEALGYGDASLKLRRIPRPSPPIEGEGASVLNVFALGALRERAVKLLSAGQRRRLALTRLEMRKADVWLLDEPVNALDAQGQALFWDCVKRHRDAGGIVVMVAHQAAVEGAKVLRMGEQ